MRSWTESILKCNDGVDVINYENENKNDETKEDCGETFSSDQPKANTVTNNGVENVEPKVDDTKASNGIVEIKETNPVEKKMNEKECDLVEAVKV